MTTLRIVRNHDDDALAGALAELGLELAKCDYSPGLPPWLAGWAARVDADTCARSACDRCGHRGLAYYPSYRVGCRQQYRAWGVCPACGEWIQF